MFTKEPGWKENVLHFSHVCEDKGLKQSGKVPRDALQTSCRRACANLSHDRVQNPEIHKLGLTKRPPSASLRE